MDEIKSLDELEIMTPKELGKLLLEEVDKNEPRVRYLRNIINAGANVNTKDINGWTPLRVAISHDKSNIAKMLISYGADVNARDNYGSTIMTILIANAYELDGVLLEKYYKMSLLLIESGLNLETRLNGGSTYLQYASRSGISTIIKILLAAGADLEARDQYGWTALHHAAEFNKIRAIRTLLKAGASKEVKDNTGKTPWDRLSDYSQRDVRELNPDYNG